VTPPLDRWDRRALIGVGWEPGVKSFEPDERDQGRRRIQDLQAQLELVMAAGVVVGGA